MSRLLRAEKLTKSFGGLTALNGVSFGVEQGKITALIGPNGSGKTTVFNLISGVLTPDSGQVFLDGRAITRWAPHRIAEQGLARTFQISRVFGQMTVWENLMVVARQKSVSASRELAVDLLAQVNLYDVRDRFGAELSYGQQRLLEFARALMLEPTVMLLDEPFAGISPTMAQTMLALISELKGQGKTIFIIDHEMKIIMTLCDSILVLDMGDLIAEGAPSEIQDNAQVLEAYFGRKGS